MRDANGLRWAPREVTVERRADGSILLSNPVPLGPVERHIPAYLRRWAAERPDQIWVAQRRGPDRTWQHVTYGEAQRIVDALTQALLDLGGPTRGPLLVLSGNSIEHALITLAGMQARIPVAPVSPAYSLMSRDHAKLRRLFGVVQPGFVFVQDAPPFAAALDALPLEGMVLLHVERPPEGQPSHAFADLARRPVTEAVARSIAVIMPETPARILFTSGSTGTPKGAVNTHGMTCANITASAQMRPQSTLAAPPAILSWLPWNHTMGSSSTLLRFLAEGGSVHIDDGRPVPGQFEETLRNLREIPVTYYSNVPAGYAMLTTALEREEALARRFFSRLEMMAYGGSTLANDLYERLQALAIRYSGRPVFFMTAWGATELGPNVTSVWWHTRRSGIIGLPLPGVEVKLLPSGTKYELRVRGHGVMPGYWSEPELTAKSFDEEGFYITGDAGVFVDPDNPSEGLEFAGRLLEDFKLSTGTFVHTGPLRVAALTAVSPILQDAIVTGHDRDFVGLLGWINLHACRALVSEPEATTETLVRHPAIIARIRDGLRAHGRAAGGSSARIGRILLMSEPPSIDGGELTDKGYINQRATRERRAALVERLHAAEPDDDVILIEA
ncbi:AMP-binding protein [Belnapia moabensis]|uniref:AMP-binding protein n=1 Tax=Belnapia moabensis TaxID=365533 RepID=UPI0005BBC468|nr:AMP-binding protein [Belnapia moabensis]